MRASRNPSAITLGDLDAFLSMLKKTNNSKLNSSRNPKKELQIQRYAVDAGEKAAYHAELEEQVKVNQKFSQK